MAVILVFDDDPLTYKRIERALKGTEHVLLESNEQAHASQTLEKMPVDLLIIAQEMNKGGTGIDFLKAQKQHPLSKHAPGEYTPFILMSRLKWDSTGFKQAAFKEGGEFLWKYKPGMESILPGLIQSAFLLALTRRIKRNT